MKNTTVRFRCIPNPNVIYTPEWEYDIPGMRKHPEYEEIDADGNVIKQAEDHIQRPLMSVAKPSEMLAPKAKGKKGK